MYILFCLVVRHLTISFQRAFENDLPYHMTTGSLREVSLTQANFQFAPAEIRDSNMSLC